MEQIPDTSMRSESELENRKKFVNWSEFSDDCHSAGDSEGFECPLRGENFGIPAVQTNMIDHLTTPLLEISLEGVLFGILMLGRTHVSSRWEIEQAD